MVIYYVHVIYYPWLRQWHSHPSADTRAIHNRDSSSQVVFSNLAQLDQWYRPKDVATTGFETQNCVARGKQTDNFRAASSSTEKSLNYFYPWHEPWLVNTPVPVWSTISKPAVQCCGVHTTLLPLQSNYAPRVKHCWNCRRCVLKWGLTPTTINVVLGLFTGRGRFYVPIFLFFGQPCGAIFDPLGNLASLPPLVFIYWPFLPWDHTNPINIDVCTKYSTF